MRVLYFSHLKAIAGCEMEQIKLSEPIAADALWEHLVNLHPGLAGHRGTVRLARNEHYAEQGDLFTDGDEVALIPPVSGG